MAGLQVMATASSTFSKVMASLQDRYKATHLHEEGDALLLAFLDPVDAVCWCLATQKVGCSHGLMPDNPAGDLCLLLRPPSSSENCCASSCCWPCMTPNMMCWSLTTWHALPVEAAQPTVCPCLQALVSAQWPVQLQMHRKTRTLTLSTLLKVSTAAAANRAASISVELPRGPQAEETPRTPGKKTVVWEQRSLDAPGELDLKEVSLWFIWRWPCCAAKLSHFFAK